MTDIGKAKYIHVIARRIVAGPPDWRSPSGCNLPPPNG
jgi:hypothetical protein